MDLSNPINLITVIVYYSLVGIISFFSIFGVYVLIRYGKSTPLALSVAILYSFFFLKILAESYLTLQTIIS